MSPGNSLFNARFFVICAFNFTVFLSGFMLFPTGPFHILDLGGNKFTAGLFLAFLTYASAFSAPFTGALADRIGKRRVLIGASLTLVVISILYALSPTYKILLSLVPIHGFFWSGLLAASGAYLVDQLPAARRAEGLAFWGLATVGAIAVAPPLAFWLYDAGGWLWICIASSLFNVIMAGIAFFLDKGERSTAEDRFEATFIEWRVLGVSLTLFLFSFGYGGVTSFVALYAQASGNASKSLYFTVLAIVILVTRPLLGLLADRIGHKRVFVPCLAFIAVGLALLVPGGTPGWLMSSAVFFGIGLGSALPVFTAYIMQRVSTARRGAAFGSMLAAFDTGIGTGSLVMGYVIEVIGYGVAFAIAALLAALALPYFFVSERRFLKEPRKKPSNKNDEAGYTTAELKGEIP